MTAQELKGLDDLCREATPGPWRAVQDHLGHWVILWPHSEVRAVARKVFSEDDAAFLAAAREGLPKLVAEVGMLRGIVDSLAARVAGQAEVLARRAEKVSPC